MRIYNINPHDASQKLSIVHAMQQGYKITLDVDGEAEVTNPKGEIYHIHNWKCDCPDSQGRDGGSYTKGDTNEHFCKHVAWASQIHPCPKCNGIMMLNTECGWRVFFCCNCPTMIPFQAVKIERQKARKEVEEISRQAEEVITEAEKAGQAVYGD